MLIYNKYLKELGYKKSDFTDSKDPRYKLDKERGIVEAQTWNLYNTIILELYTYLRDFQDNYMKLATPLVYAEKWEDGKTVPIEGGDKEWHKIVGQIVDGLKAYIIASNLDSWGRDWDEYIKERGELYAQFDEAWELLGENIGYFWW